MCEPSDYANEAFDKIRSMTYVCEYKGKYFVNFYFEPDYNPVTVIQEAIDKATKDIEKRNDKLRDELSDSIWYGGGD